MMDARLEGSVSPRHEEDIHDQDDGYHNASVIPPLIQVHF
mgnify:CR=1 FL=1